jgi:di/tricarboxylate transporter
MILTFIILALTIILFISDRLRIDIVAMLALLALTLTGLIDANQALAGFANSTVVTIAALFVVGAGLFKTGVADWLGSRLLDLAGASETRLLILLMIGTAILSGFMSNTGTVAVLLPALVAAAWRIGSPPSKLLIPLAFAAQIGGLLTLIGTPPNIVITNALSKAGVRPFGFFEFSLIGLPLLAVGVIYMIMVGRRWLPERKVEERHLSSLASPAELTDAYHLDNCLFRLRVRRGSGLAGRTLAETGLGHDYGIMVLRIERAGATARSESMGQHTLGHISDRLGLIQEDTGTQAPGPETVIYVDDVLLVEGIPEAAQQLALRYNLGLRPIDAHQGSADTELLSHEIGLAEVLLTPRSALIGRTITQTHFAEKYNVWVLGISRRGRALENVPLTTVKLTFGDALLVRGAWQAIGILENEARNFVVVGRPAAMLKPGGLTPQAITALLALSAMLMLLLTGIVPTVIAVIITAMIMVLGGCLSMEQAYRAINWESVILIAAMLPMSTALQATGGAEFIATGLVNTLGALHPLWLLAGMFLLTTAFTQVISNTATTVLVAPIALQAAIDLGVSPQAVMMMVAIGASTAFLTPIASPVNTLVLTPGGYRFGDFMQVGLPLLVLFLIVSLIVVPLVWPL